MSMYPYYSGFAPNNSAYSYPIWPNANPNFTGLPGMNPAMPSPIPSIQPALGIARTATDHFTAIQSQENSAEADITFSNFNELTPENIRREGNIQGMLFDVDDTLSKYKLGGDRTIPPELIQQLVLLQTSGMKIGIVSNNSDEKLLLKFQEELATAGIQVAMISQAQKPDPKGLLMMQENYLQLPPDQIMMVGDNPSTDVASGKNAGFKTAQVDWFNTSGLHKTGMEIGDTASRFLNDVTSFFGSDSNEPKFFPPLGAGG